MKKPHGRPRSLITPAQFNDTIVRWEAGESLAEIARSYDVDMRSLCYHTRNARKGKTGGIIRELLSSKELVKICKRISAGELLATIAKSYYMSEKTLNSILGKTNMPLKREGNLSAERIAAVVTRWKHLTGEEVSCAVMRCHAGEQIKNIADDFRVSKEDMSNVLICIYWKCGVTIDNIAHRFGKTRLATSKIIKKHYSAADEK